jgi:glutathione S-transferase
MITLYVFGPGFGLPDPSHFVMKTEIQLKMAWLAYRTDTTGFHAAPKGKLPYIDDDGVKVPDSTFIRAHIERKYKLDLDAALSPRERADSWAIERMLEDHLGWAMGHARWLIPENFAKGPAHFFDGAPEAMREKLRSDALAKVTASMWGHGIGRHSLDEIAALADRSLSSLSTLLGDREYVMGDKIAAVDALAAPLLASILTPFFESKVRDAAEKYDNLVAYADRVMGQYYPVEGAESIDAEAEKAMA